MIRGLYTSESGMIAEMHRMNVISNNLANVNSTGYKKDKVNLKAFPEMLLREISGSGLMQVKGKVYDKAPYLGKMGTGVEVYRTYTDFTQGSIKETHNRLDFCIDGKGFFVLKNSQDQSVSYTRSAEFTLDSQGYLVNSDGLKVQGSQGDIFLGDIDIIVSKQGNIENVHTNQLIDSFQLINFDNPEYLIKSGSGLYQESEYSGQANLLNGRHINVLQGFLETSNVNPIQELVQMIEVQRTYEANQKVISTHDQLLGKAVNDIARI